MALSAGSVVGDSVKFIRSVIASGVTDPVSATRSSNSAFLNTAFPSHDVNYPLIVVEGRQGNVRGIANYANTTQVGVDLTIHVWSKNVKERDQLSDAVMYQLGSAQSGTSAFGLHDFTVSSTNNVDDPGIVGPHRRVMEISYWTVV